MPADRPRIGLARSFRLFHWCVAAYLCAVPLGGAPVSAQPVHLPPYVRPELPSDTSALALLRILAPTDSSDALPSGSVIALRDRRLWFMSANQPWEVVELGNATVLELIERLRARVPGLRVSSDFPDLHVRYLGDLPPTAVSNDTVVVPARHSGGDVSVVGGVVFTLNSSVSRADESDLLSRSGLQLDLLGSYQFGSGSSVRGRIGLRTNEPVSTEEVGDLEPLVSSAAQFLIGSQFNFPMSREGLVTVLGSIDASVEWFQRDFLPLAATVDSAAIANTDPDFVTTLELAQNRVEPTFSVLVGPTAVFGTEGDVRFYIGLAAGWRGFRHSFVHEFDRVVEVVRNESGEIVDVITERRAGIDAFTIHRAIWRYTTGIRLGDLFNVRMDVRGDFEALDGFFRVVLSRGIRLT